jgi:hypothetical protein
MWKVVVTEIQDAHALDPLGVPAGAFFVSEERFARTVENLDLRALITAIDRMQSSQECGREPRRMASGKPARRAAASRHASSMSLATPIGASAGDSSSTTRAFATRTDS